MKLGIEGLPAEGPVRHSHSGSRLAGRNQWGGRPAGRLLPLQPHCRR